MVNELVKDKSYNLDFECYNLFFLKEIFRDNYFYLLEDLEIEPFHSFTLSFSAEYWYLKYYLIKDNLFLISEENLALFEEKDINIIFIKISDLKSFNLNCEDGKWNIKIYEYDSLTQRIFNYFKKTIIY